MLYYERKFKKQGCNVIIGVDEAGRGPLAGPVVAAAVHLTTTRFKHRIDDSKKLSALQREHAYAEIMRRAEFGIGIIDEKLIDYFNILCASRMAMDQAVAALMDKLPDDILFRQGVRVLVDGNVGLHSTYPQTTIIGGDGKSLSIAAASILAKVTRDRIMDLYDGLFPGYGFLRHKGYPTKEHRLALDKLGPTAIHRNTFCGVC